MKSKMLFLLALLVAPSIAFADTAYVETARCKYNLDIYKATLNGTVVVGTAVGEPAFRYMCLSRYSPRCVSQINDSSATTCQTAALKNAAKLCTDPKFASLKPKFVKPVGMKITGSIYPYGGAFTKKISSTAMVKCY